MSNMPIKKNHKKNKNQKNRSIELREARERELKELITKAAKLSKSRKRLLNAAFKGRDLKKMDFYTFYICFRQAYKEAVMSDISDIDRRIDEYDYPRYEHGTRKNSLLHGLKPAF